MVGKKANLLRVYHLLIAREHEGYTWQIRYGRNARPAETSDRTYPSQAEAAEAGAKALARHREGVPVEPA